jgi:hypothetical protein
LLQDPHTVVATLDPLRSFGPSAFGALRLRAVFPAASSSASKDPSKDVSSRPEAHPERAEGGDGVESGVPGERSLLDGVRPGSPALAASTTALSDWLPLATLVRLPTLSQLTCPTDDTQLCTLTGSNLFLIEALSTDPAFANPIAVPDGYTGTTLTLPRPTANTLFLRLRDDPAPIDSAVFPGPPVAAHTRRLAKPAAAMPAPAPPAATTPTQPAGPATSPGPSR